MSAVSPFHEGERRVHARLGVPPELESWAGRAVRPCLPAQHREFHTALPFLVAAARDATGRPWATLLTGPPGFVSSPDDRHLEMAARPLPGDALASALVPGAALGLLGIDLASRRRNRVNGRIERIDPVPGETRLRFRVDQSFGNCPQYIHPREWRRVSVSEADAQVLQGSRLTEAQRRLLTRADTLFIASGHAGDGAQHGMDASHRGGAPGFVEVVDETRLVIPDYAGNNHFNTIGNLVMDPRAGLLFVDFETGHVLQLTGRVQIDWDSPALARHPGAQRLLVFDVEAWRELRGVLPLRWRAAAPARSLRVLEKRRESEDVVSLLLGDADGTPLPAFAPGQHLPVSVEAPGQAAPATRTYSLSAAPHAGHYRLGVKREPQGLVSRYLHDQLSVGEMLATGTPGGEFLLEPGRRPVVLLAAGVGITPLLAMLHALAGPGETREVFVAHGARDRAHRPFAHELQRLAAARPGIRLLTAHSRPAPGERAGRHFDHHGRLDGATVLGWLPDVDADFYLCGPAAFMADVSKTLAASGVPPARLHAETFGPATG